MEILKRRYKVRPVAYHYRQVMIPPECHLKLGEEVTAIYSENWVLVVPAGTKVDEPAIEKAIGEPKGEESNGIVRTDKHI